MSNVESTLENQPSQVGQTSESTGSSDSENKANGFNVWNAMLVIATICILVACLLLVFELREFSDFPFSFPWNTRTEGS